MPFVGGASGIVRKEKPKPVHVITIPSPSQSAFQRPSQAAQLLGHLRSHPIVKKICPPGTLPARNTIETSNDTSPSPQLINQPPVTPYECPLVKKKVNVTKCVAATSKASPAVDDPPVCLHGIKYTYDLHSSAWIKSGTVIRVPHPNRGLAQGGMRVCFEVEELDERGFGIPMVAKMFRRNISDVVEKDYFNEGEAQCMCEEFANNFNHTMLTDSSVSKPNISFLQCYVVRFAMCDIPERHLSSSKGFFSYRTKDTEEVMFVMEPKLSGTFTKYNSNFGETYESEKAVLMTHSQTKRRAEIFEAAEAFSHFTLVESGGSMLVCDLQGVNDFLTDPQIHTEDGKGLGMGNMGQEGILKWLQKHRCNRICEALRLQPLNRDSLASDASRADNHYVGLRAQLQNQKPVRLQDLVPLSKPLGEMTEDECIEYAMRLSHLTS